MPTPLSPTAQLDRLDKQICRLRAMLVEMAVAVSVSRPELRTRALEACIRAGLQTAPYCNLLRDVDYVIGEVAKWSLPVTKKLTTGAITPSPDDHHRVGFTVPPWTPLPGPPAWCREVASRHLFDLQWVI
jgi:predicted transcriptional regulator